MKVQLELINNAVEKYIAKTVPERYFTKIQLRMSSDSGMLHVVSKFGPPHLDVDIAIQPDGEFTANYSNGNYSEHWHKNISPDETALKIVNIINSLIENGAIQTDMIYRGRVYSTTTEVPNADRTTALMKFNPFTIKKKVVTVYPPLN